MQTERTKEYRTNRQNRHDSNIAAQPDAWHWKRLPQKEAASESNPRMRAAANVSTILKMERTPFINRSAKHAAGNKIVNNTFRNADTPTRGNEHEKARSA